MTYPSLHARRHAARPPAAALPALFAAALLALPFAVSSAPAGSPKAAVEAERKAVLAATSLDEVIEYVPAEWREYVKGMPKEDKDEQLADWKQRLDKVKLEEFVAGNRAAVLLESADPASLDVRILEHDGERWNQVGETQLMSAIAGARGSYAADGAVAASLEDGLIRQDWINGIPLLTIRNELAQVVDESAAVPSVVLVLPDCVSVGTLELGMREADNMKIGNSFEAPGPDDEMLVFRDDATGILQVRSTTDDRFSGDFELTARKESPSGAGLGADDGARVTVRGRIENARNPCAP